MKKKLSDTVAEKLIQYILDSHLQEGDKLPNETSLASQLGVGRNTVREAMRILASRNIIRVRQGSGMYVAGQTGLNDDPLGLLFIPDKMRLTEDLLTIRIMLEPPIAAMAARNATQEDIAALHHHHAEVTQRILDGKEYHEQDAALHTAIAMASKNMVVPRLIPIIHTTISMLIDVTQKALDKEAISAHGELVQAISEHDPTAAQDAMHVHLLPNRQLIHRLNKQFQHADRAEGVYSFGIRLKKRAKCDA